MAVVDWIIVIAFIGALVGVGFWFSRSNRNIRDYFLAGKSMPGWLVALAATGTSVSAGTFVGSPELGFNTNLTYLMLCVGAIFGGLLVARFFLPRLYNAGTITIYGFIGERFGEGSKRWTSGMFLLGQLFTSGSRLFIAAIAVSVILYGSIHFQFLVYSILILGVISTLYTMAGGIKGLLYIDALQILLVVGTGLVALVLVYVSMTPDLSFGQIWDSLVHGQVKIAGQWEPGNKLQVVDASWRFDLPYNLVGALLAATVFKVAQFSTDQEFVQRQLTCRDVRKAGSSLVASQVISLPIVLVFLSIGLLLFSKYSQTDPAAFAQYQGDARDLFPQYICHCIPAGLRGLMMVGLLAAALSSFNSAINSMASSFTADLYLPIRRQRGRALETDSAQMASSKKMTVFMGLALTGFAIFTAVLQSMSGMNLVDFATGVMCFSYAGMLGVFLTALFTRRGNARSVVAALIAGLLVAFFLMTAKSLFCVNLTVAWPWWTPIGGIVSFLICLSGKPDSRSSKQPMPTRCR